MTSEVSVFTYGSDLALGVPNRRSMRSSKRGIATPLTTTSRPATQYRSGRSPVVRDAVVDAGQHPRLPPRRR